MEQTTLHPHQHIDESPEQAERKTIRARGGINLVIGLVLGALSVPWLMTTLRSSGNPMLLIGAATPWVLAAVGLLEMGTGVSFLRVAEAWDALRGWQRGVLCVLALVAVIMMLMGVAALAF